MPGGLPANVFGTIVHRLCELTPPEDDVPELVAQLLTNAQQRGELSKELDEGLIEVASAAAYERARKVEDTVSAISSGLAVNARYDEFRIDAEFDGLNEFDVDTVTLTGEIDHLIATEEAYYVIDYKTDRPGNQDPAAFLKTQSTHHQPQIFAYAAALKQLDPSREVHASLIFTGVSGRTADWHNIEQPWERLIKMLAR